MATVLAIETSCDETAVAIVRNRKVLSSVVRSQMDLHSLYGGVVPELASRQHLEMVNPAIALALEQAGLGWDGIDGVAATVAPGLVGALLVGVMAAKTLAMLRRKPFLGVHHLEGHIYATYLDQPDLEPPFLCLLVSGGHTSLIEVKGCGVYQTWGQTRDDAAGEAFDKVARLLKLGYPGGPIVDRLAAEGNAKAFKLPEGRVSLPEGGFHPYDFSFSGLKTAMLRLIQRLEQERLDQERLEQERLDQDGADLPLQDLCASFQATVVEVLTKRTLRCAQDRGLKTIAVGGGVAANRGLRQGLTAQAQPLGLRVVFPPLSLCTDNAAMIACAAAAHLEQGHVSDLALGVQSRLGLEGVMSLYPH